MDSYQISNFNFQLIRVAIVDDHTVVAEGFERLINASGVAGVTGIAYSVSGCLKLLAHNKTDVLLLDVNLPDGNGIDLYQQIKSLYPDLRVIILTSNTEKSIIKRALDKSYRKRLMLKLNVTNTAELVRMAIEKQLI
jgi:two-component system response regulator DegU